MWHRVLICGDQEWAAVQPIRKVLGHLQHRWGSKLVVIVGGAPGADTLAEEIAQELGIHTALVEALWEEYERSAGPMRNAAMLALCPHEVIAFHEDLHKSKGTADMVRRARKAGTVRVRVCRQRRL